MNIQRFSRPGVALIGAILLFVTLLAVLAPGRIQAGHPLDNEGAAPEAQIDPWMPPRDVGEYPPVGDPDPIIQEMIDQVLTETVILYDGGLSGEWPVTIGGNPYTIATRHTYSGEPIQKATQYVGEHMAGLGMPVEYHTWSGATYPNVIGEITGLSNPDEIYMIVAHLDDMPSGGFAPGADDNASGSAGVMIAADILSQYAWDCTLRFAFFTGEEQGLLGSFAYAQRAYNLGDDIHGVLNMDMLGWNTPLSTPYIELHANAGIPATLDMADLFADVVSTYNLDLIPQIIPNGTGSSDHYAFWQYGYPAILSIEDFGDFNPYYHTTQDTLDKLDIPYFTDLVRANVATFAHLTECLVPPEDDGTLTGRVTSTENGQPIAGASISIDDLPPVMTDSQGYYTATAPAGVYTVTAAAMGFESQTVTDIAITNGGITNLDFSLQPSLLNGTLAGRVTDAVAGTPIAGALVEIGDSNQAFTDPQGYYTTTVQVGVYSVSASAGGYFTQTVDNIIVAYGTITIQDFSLEPLPPPLDKLVYIPLIMNEPE